MRAGLPGDRRPQREPSRRGSAWPDLAIADGRRASPAVAYLRPALSRPNLTVLDGCLVTRLLIRDGRCTGAEYLRDGSLQQASATAEVIVCAGAVGSPQLLMLSGIGPAGHLRDLGIDPVANLPGVGANLQDHPVAMACYASAAAAARQPVQPRRGLRLAVQPARRRLARPAPVPRSCCPSPRPAYPRPRKRLRPGGQRDRPGQPGHRSGWPPPARLAAPLIDPGFLREPADLERLETGLAMIRHAAAGAAFAPARRDRGHPGPAVRGGELRDWIRRTVEQLLPPGRHLPDRPRHRPAARSSTRNCASTASAGCGSPTRR